MDKQTDRWGSRKCLLAENLIDKEDELIITNCDQYLDWNVEDFLEKSRKRYFWFCTYISIKGS